MRKPLDVEGVDLEKVADELRDMCGACVGGAVVGRQRLRDAVGEQLHCSSIEAKTLVDALVAKRFVVARLDLAGDVEWLIGTAGRPRSF